MQVRWRLVCAVLLAGAHAASAQVAPHAPVAQQAPTPGPAPAEDAPPAYPTISVDRPVLLFAGMTTVDLSADVAHFPDGAFDVAEASSVTAHTRATPDLTLAHSFGTVQIAAYGTRDAAGASVAVQSSAVPWGYAVLSVQDFSVGDGNGGGHDYAQNLSYFYKKIVTPHRFAFYSGFGAHLSELKITLPSTVTVTGHVATVSVNVAFEVQATERLSVALGARVDSVVDRSNGLSGDQYLDAGATVRVATHRFDLYGHFAFTDVTHTTAIAATVGAICRFGM